jgi:hypothetical protein
MTDGDAVALARAEFEQVVSIEEFMRATVRPILERVVNQNDHGDGTAFGGFLRALGWLASIRLLNHPQYFQAVISGARALFEIAIDLALLSHDRAKYPVAMVTTWERSAKLKAAERVTKHFRGQTLPREHNERVAYVNREGATIRAERLATWGSEKCHPARWTGKDLGADAIAVDALGDYGFEAYYNARFAELC